MSWRHIVPSLLTMLALVAGFFSMVACMDKDYLLAAQLILFSMLIDGLDGTIARLLRGTTKFGAELDTFVDMTSFGLAPAFLLYSMVLKDAGILGMVVVAFYIISGASRLSRFRIVDPFRGQCGFLGLPITAAGGYVSVFVIMSESGIFDETWFSMAHGPVARFFWITVLLMLMLQVSHIRYGKPTKNILSFVPYTLCLMMLFMKPQFAAASALVMCGYGLYFAFVSPFFRRQHRVTISASEDEEEESFSVRHP